MRASPAASLYTSKPARRKHFLKLFNAIIACLGVQKLLLFPTYHLSGVYLHVRVVVRPRGPSLPRALLAPNVPVTPTQGSLSIQNDSFVVLGAPGEGRREAA
jgi:hypothetical protein